MQLLVLTCFGASFVVWLDLIVADGIIQIHGTNDTGLLHII